MPPFSIYHIGISSKYQSQSETSLLDAHIQAVSPKARQSYLLFHLC